MPGQIALTVAVEVELAGPSTTGDGLLEHAGEDGSPLPRHVFRRSHVDREQPPDPLSSGLGRLDALRPRAQAHRVTVAGIEATDRCAKTAVRTRFRRRAPGSARPSLTRRMNGSAPPSRPCSGAQCDFVARNPRKLRKYR